MKLFTTLSALAIGTVMIAGCKKDEADKKISPTACIETSGSTFEVGETIDFENCSVNGKSYLWEFGDGETSTSKNPEYAYSSPGEYEVELKVTSIDGLTDKKTKTITIQGPTAADYAGTFDVTDVCQSDTYAYPITITATSANTISISNIGGYSTPVTVAATVSGYNFTITSTTSSTGVIITGSGVISSDFQQINTNTIDNSSDACSGTGIKQ